MITAFCTDAPRPEGGQGAGRQQDHERQQANRSLNRKWLALERRRQRRAQHAEDEDQRRDWQPGADRADERDDQQDRHANRPDAGQSGRDQPRGSATDEEERRIEITPIRCESVTDGREDVVARGDRGQDGLPRLARLVLPECSAPCLGATQPRAGGATKAGRTHRGAGDTTWFPTPTLRDRRADLQD